MGFTLVVVYSGLIAFVPRMDYQEAMAFLVNAEMHRARIELDCGNLEDGSSIQYACYNSWHKSEYNTELKYMTLNQANVSFGSGLPSPLQWTTGLRLGGHRYHSDKDVNDLAWVPEIASILETKATLGPDYFKRPLPDSLKGLIEARVRMSQGRLRTQSVRYGLWDFETANGYVTYSQEVAKQVEYDLWTPGGTIDIAIDAQTLRLHPTNNQTFVLVYVTNEPSLDEACRELGIAKFDHFGAFFRFAGIPTNGDLPVPISYGDEGRGTLCGQGVLGRMIKRSGGIDKMTAEYRRRVALEQHTEDPGAGRYPFICMGTQFSPSEF
ncbi:MAG TPA: hypothetical protein VHR45_19845 [Thermoanaerobaculia bacterium]|nr:hypothetical protein [Thermoanaerobaculia bacterium]